MDGSPGRCGFRHVSIPLRYAKNRSGQYSRTRSTSFQFLLGTLKTSVCVKQAKEEIEFQFLLGTLKTVLVSVSRMKPVSVSIPLRYAKNPMRTEHCGAGNMVSIPLRYAKNGLGRDDLCRH